MDRVRQRVGDKRVLALVKAFLKAGILTEDGTLADTSAGSPQGSILSPLLSNVALSVLDEYIAQGPGGPGASPYERAKRRRQGLPNYRLARYADDWCLAVSGTKAHAEALKEEIAGVLATMGLRLSPEKTLITHIDEGLDFLGWRIQRHRKRGTGKYYVYVYPAKKALAAIKAKIKAWCRQSMNLPLECPAHPSQPDTAWLDRVLQVRMLERDLQLSEVLPVETGGQVAGAQAPAHSHGNNCADATASGPATGPWSCSTRPESAPGATTTGEQRSRHHGRAQYEASARPSGACGAPGALRGARRVREATRRNGPVVTPAPRPGSTSPVFVMEVRDRPSPRRRSGGVKLEAAGAGGRRGRQEQPRQSRAGSVLPDGPGPVSETGRYTRETGVVTPLEQAPALTRWIRAGMRCAPAFHDGRGTPGRVCEVWAWRPR